MGSKHPRGVQSIPVMQSVTWLLKHFSVQSFFLHVFESLALLKLSVQIKGVWNVIVEEESLQGNPNT